MTVIVAKLPRRNYTSPNGEFNLYTVRLTGGRWGSAVYIGDDPPKPLKTVEYTLVGDWEVNEKCREGKQFCIRSYRRVQKQPHRDELAIARELKKRI